MAVDMRGPRIQQIPASISDASDASLHAKRYQSTITAVSGTAVNVSETDGLELAICLQGSGPHFCPGGNPNARRRSGESILQVEPFSMFLAILRLKEFGGPIAVALQGLVLGGGLAMAMLADLSVLDANASVCFGNLSRGMVPCMLLSLHFALGLAEALDLYLTDDIASAATWQQFTGDTLVDGVLEAKTEAFGALRRMRQSYVATQLTQLTFDNFQLRFAREAQALQLSLRCESSPLVTTTRDGLVDVPNFKTLNHDDVKVELNLQPTKAQQESVLQHISIPVPSAHKLDVSTLQPA